MSDAPRNSGAVQPGWYNDGSGRRRWWTGTAWGEQFEVDAAPFVSSRVPGFVLGLIAVLFIGLPIVCLPLGIVGWVQSAKALKAIPVGQMGRGLAMAGLILSIVAVSLTTLIMLLAIPGAYQHNFG